MIEVEKSYNINYDIQLNEKSPIKETLYQE